MTDQDCDGFDGGYQDDDGDGHTFCNECNDNDPTIYPGAPEIACDGIDQDCNGLDDGDVDNDGDGFTECTDCDDADVTIYPGAIDIPGDGIDQDCNGSDAAICCSNSGDVNNDGVINILDIVYLINFQYKGGAGPVCATK